MGFIEIQLSADAKMLAGANRSANTDPQLQAAAFAASVAVRLPQR